MPRVETFLLPRKFLVSRLWIWFLLYTDLALVLEQVFDKTNGSPLIYPMPRDVN